MELSYSTDSFIVASIILTLITIVPVKIGASFVGAANTSFGASAIAVVLGLIGAFTVFNMLDGLTSIVAAYITISIIYWLVLKPSLIASFGLTVLVMFIQLAIVQGLVKFGGYIGS